MTPMHLTPAEYAIQQFGGIRKLARRLGVDPSSGPHRWLKSQEHGGCDGQIPRMYQMPLLDAAKEDGLDLTAEDVIRGRTVA